VQIVLVKLVKLDALNVKIKIRVINVIILCMNFKIAHVFIKDNAINIVKLVHQLLSTSINILNKILFKKKKFEINFKLLVLHKFLLFEYNKLNNLIMLTMQL